MTFIPGTVSSSDLIFRTLEPVRKTGSFVLEAGHAGQRIEIDSPVDATVTIPTALSVSYPEKGYTEFAQIGVGRVILAAASGVTIRTFGGLRTAGQYDAISIYRRPGAATGLPANNQVMNFDADNIPGSTSGATVAAWSDASPATLPDLAATDMPTIITNAINGHKALSFNGTSNFMTFSGAGLDLFRNRNVMTLSAVLQYQTGVTGARTPFNMSTGVGTTARAYLQMRDQANGFPAAGARALDTDTGSAAIGTSIIAAPETFVLTAEYEYIAKRLTLYKNGTQIAQNINWQSGVNSSDTRSLSGRIGSNVSGAEFYFGRIARIVAYNEVSSSLRASIHSDAQITYGITVSDFGGLGNEWFSEGGVV